MWSVERFNEYDANDILFVCKTEEFAKKAVSKLNLAAKKRNVKDTTKTVVVGSLSIPVYRDDIYRHVKLEYIDN